MIGTRVEWEVGEQVEAVVGKLVLRGAMVARRARRVTRLLDVSDDYSGYGRGLYAFSFSSSVEGGWIDVGAPRYKLFSRKQSTITHSFFFPLVSISISLFFL